MTPHHTPARYVVIATHNRPDDLHACLAAIGPQADTAVVIDNASDPPVDIDDLAGLASRIALIAEPEQPPNLSRLWNVGLDTVEQIADRSGHTVWDVAILNDDAIVPDGWYDACTAAMRAGPAVVGCSDPYGTLAAPLLKTEPDGDLMTRMCPWAFVTRGEARQRSDESMRWWWFDADWDVRARLAGGVAMVPGFMTFNRRANSTTVGVLAEQAGRDRARFIEIWGSAPW